MCARDMVRASIYDKQGTFCNTYLSTLRNFHLAGGGAIMTLDMDKFLAVLLRKQRRNGQMAVVDTYVSRMTLRSR